jgi:hypothetical protein
MKLEKLKFKSIFDEKLTKLTSEELHLLKGGEYQPLCNNNELFTVITSSKFVEITTAQAVTKIRKISSWN